MQWWWPLLFGVPTLLAVVIGHWLQTGGRRGARGLSMKLPVERRVAMASSAAADARQYRDASSLPGRATLRATGLVDDRGASLFIDDVTVGEERVRVGRVWGPSLRFRRWDGTVWVPTGEVAHVEAVPVPGGVRLEARTPVLHVLAACGAAAVVLSVMLGLLSPWAWAAAPLVAAALALPVVWSTRRRLTPIVERAMEAIAVRIDASHPRVRVEVGAADDGDVEQEVPAAVRGARA